MKRAFARVLVHSRDSLSKTKTGPSLHRQTVHAIIKKAARMFAVWGKKEAHQSTRYVPSPSPLYFASQKNACTAVTSSKFPDSCPSSFSLSAPSVFSLFNDTVATQTRARAHAHANTHESLHHQAKINTSCYSFPTDTFSELKRRYFLDSARTALALSQSITRSCRSQKLLTPSHLWGE